MATVTNETELRFEIQSGTDPEILVANDITVRTFASVNRSVTIRTVPGNPTATLFWSPASGVTNQYLFHVYSSGNLTIDTLTIDGEGRNCGLIRLSGGTYTMNDGVTLTGIRSNTSNSAVLVGDMTSTVGGTFIMNGGLITGADAGPHTVVFCAGGTVVMSGDAAIENNPSCGLTAMHNIIDNTRSNVRITGNARIANNQAGQSGGGVVFLMTDAVIGESENDAPLITGNYSPYSAGGIYILESSDVSIGGRAEISGNSALETAGGIAMQTGSVLRMSGNAKVTGNSCGSYGGGMNITSNSTVIIEGNVEISENTSGAESVAGGIILQTGSSLEIKGNASVRNNTALNGGGIYIAAPSQGSAYSPPSAVIGTENSSPSIYANTAGNLGGGIFIEDRCSLTLTGQTRVYNNSAVRGKGVYNDGILKTSGSPKILDGLFFDCILGKIYGDSIESTEMLRIESGGSEISKIKYETMLYGASEITFKEADDSFAVGSIFGTEPLQCGKAPIIDEALTSEAEMHVEASGHVALPNVPLVIAVGDTDTIPLTENDRAAWQIPGIFNPGYAVMLTAGLDQVIIDAVAYKIVYNNLKGAVNPNPVSYKINGLPIKFASPGERKGYVFAGWRDGAGRSVTEIPAGSTGDLSLTAVWQAQVYKIEYNSLFGSTHRNPPSYNVEELPILLSPPGERKGYAFIRWQNAAGSPVTEVSAGSTGDLAFTAVWQEQIYNITYYNLFGAANPNPASYTTENLPITLAAPGERFGYSFAGWRDAAGNIVTEIPAGSTEDLAFTALWQAQAYNITYNNLFGAPNPNPASYSPENLPIILAAPGERPGYSFAGWRNAAGNVVTEIPAGSTGDLVFTALWNELFLSFDGNAPCVCNVPNTIRAENGTAQIPWVKPCRPNYAFISWNELNSGGGKYYYPGDKINISGENVTLYAQWIFVGCCCR